MNAHESFFALLTGIKPAAGDAVPAARPGPDDNAPHAPPGLWTVLCVDADAHTQFALKRVLRGAGYCVMAAANGEQALQMLRAMGQRSMVDVVLSEMQLPGEMSGADLLEQVHAQWPQMVRIVLTGHADLGATIAAINRGRVLRHLAKPWDSAELLATLCDGIGRLSAARSTQRQHALVQAQNEALLRQNAELEARLQDGGGVQLQQGALPASAGLPAALPASPTASASASASASPAVPGLAMAAAASGGSNPGADGGPAPTPASGATAPAVLHPIPIPSAALEPGMELAGDLISHRGVLMLMAGHRFTLSLIRRVRDFERREGSPLLIHIQPNQNPRTPE